MVTRVRHTYRANGFVDRIFADEIIRVDGNNFYGCTFINCTLEFAAIEVPSFENCRFKDSEWVFIEAAASTIAFLSQLPHDFGQSGRELFENLFKQLASQRIEAPSRAKVPREQYVATATPSSLVVSLNEVPAEDHSGLFRKAR